MDTREEFVGKFELGNKVDITDPCYNKGAWCRMATDCRPGTWYGYATISDKGEWGDRVATLCIYLDDRKDPEPFWELIGNIGVDAGMAGFFRDKPDYTDEEWYQFCSQFDHRKRYTGLDYGVVSESGYGGRRLRCVHKCRPFRVHAGILVRRRRRIRRVFPGNTTRKTKIQPNRQRICCLFFAQKTVFKRRWRACEND